MCGGMQYGGTIVIGEQAQLLPHHLYSVDYVELCLCPQSSLKAPSSLLGKPGFVVHLGSFGWVNEVDSTAEVLKYERGESSIASNVCESNKLMENGAERN